MTTTSRCPANVGWLATGGDRCDFDTTIARTKPTYIRLAGHPHRPGGPEPLRSYVDNMEAHSRPSPSYWATAMVIETDSIDLSLFICPG
jgi:hypothetical protein